MADIWVTGFLPEGWADFAALLGKIVPAGAALYRWEQHSYEDGARRRAAHLIRSATGPTIEAIRSAVLDGARREGFALKRLEDDGAATILGDSDRGLRIGTAPLPPRVTVELADRVARRGAAEFPPILDAFRLAANAGAATLERVDRFAELDLETQNRFGAPTTHARTRGEYDAALLCKSLDAAQFVEDGDRWYRDDAHVTLEVRLRDGAVDIDVVPR